MSPSKRSEPQMSQREAVFNAVVEVKGMDEFDGQVELTKEEKAEVYGMIAEGFKSGSVVLDDTPANQEKLADQRKMNTYISGLVSNWLRKDPRLNGGGKYVPANPGSRTNGQDPQLQALRALAKKFEGDEQKLATIEKHIATRHAQIKEEKRKASINDIDVSNLPKELVQTLGLGN